MGNQHSSRPNHHHPPVQWTQSFPRDHRRLHKMGVSSDHRVLPERAPTEQRLRATENGRSLQVAGTITGRRVSQPPDHHPVGPQSLPGYMRPVPQPCQAHPHGPLPLHALHSNSMTHLHQPGVMHPGQGMEPTSRAGSMHELRFGPLPTKVYTSEPDLRVGGNIPPPIKHSPPHTIISQSPTKGRIKSKKRNRAPPPPVNNDGTFSDGYISEQHRMNHEGTRAVHWGASDTQSRPTSQVSSHKSKGKSRKIGLFKKRNESRKSDNESSFTDDQSRSKPKSALASSSSDREERRERARSVDCLQHELRRNSPHVPTIHITGVQGSSSDETVTSSDRENHRRSQTIERDSRKKSNDDRNHRLSTTLERNPRSLDRESQRRIDYRSHSRTDGQTQEMEQNHSYLNKKFNPVSYGVPRDNTPVERKSSSSVRRGRSPISRAFDEWEEAEKDVLRRKKISDNMKQELLTAAKNLKRPSDENKDDKTTSKIINGIKEIRKEHTTEVTSPAKLNSAVDEIDSPKTFFFGMEPGTPSDAAKNKAHTNKLVQTPINKTIQTESVRIEGGSVGYAKRNNEVIERNRSKSRENNVSRVSNHSDNKNIPAQKDDIDEFAVAIERNKHNFIRDDLFAGSMRREDGGYHSRQNSGSFHLENENPSDEDGGITVNLRPILPKRQREIPRFSPNAAWRFLGEEPFLADDNNLNESRSSEEVDVVYEDKIRGYSRPVAPPRGSGEKSADSGISGDAGSPGPMPEFEPIIPSTSIKITNNGPLAASSPVASGRSEVRRTWTPAQDLDENSLEGSGENPSHRTQASVMTPPKLTSRANMFTIFGMHKETALNGSGINNKTDKSSRNRSNTIEESTQTMSNLRKLKRSVSGSVNPPNTDQVIESLAKINSKNIQSDKWRDNWCMTRSIPNSLNKCDDGDRNAPISNKLDCSKSDLNPSPYRRLDSSEGSRARSVARQNGQGGGHIMYLPEYISRKVLPGEEEQQVDNGEIRSRDLNSSKHLNRSFSSEEQADSSPRNLNGAKNSSPPKSLPHLFNSSLGGRLKKSKKFSYQSTVRVLEKKKIEAQLNREVEAKEQQRLQEASAMRQVEEEFQFKREQEKKRLKQQLKIYQAMQSTGQNKTSSGDSPTYTRNTSLNYPDESSDRPNSPIDASFEDFSKSTSKKTFNQNQSSASYDLPNGFHHSKVDYQSDNSRSYSNDSSKEFPSNSGDDYTTSRGKEQQYYRHGSPKEEPVQAVLRPAPRDDRLSGRRPYNGDDTRSSTVSSVSGMSVEGRRQAPDGAPSSVLGPRAEVLAASRSRNGLLTQELPEHQLPRREYKEYRRSQRSSSAQGGGVGDNYRRDFSRGQVQQLPDDRTSSDGRRSQDGRASDLLETSSHASSSVVVGGKTQQPLGGVKTHIIRTPQSARGVTKYYEHPPAMVNMSPAQVTTDGAYNRHVVQPFTPGYRPVNFSPSVNRKLLRT